VQVHGGMGYIEETGAAQHLRDARINLIYEGTNGIQALDLATRKLAQADGQLPWMLLDELRADLSALERAGEETLRRPLAGALEAFEQATRWLQVRSKDPDEQAAGATPYLRLAAATLGGFLLARSALRADVQGESLAAAKMAHARFFATQILPPAAALLPAVTAGSAPLRMDPAVSP
jgi:acyl-CoA dehydrogenase